MAQTEFLYNTNDEYSIEKLKRHLDYLNEKHVGQKVTYLFTMKKNRPVRSTSQNAYYWVLVTAIAGHTGETKERMHYILGVKFIPDTPIEVEPGVLVPVPRSTKSLDTMEMKVYLEKVKQIALDMEIRLREPGDQFYSAWEREVNSAYDSLFESA
jgi:hypothetical protein